MDWQDRVDLVTQVVLAQWSHMRTCQCTTCCLKRGEGWKTWPYPKDSNPVTGQFHLGPLSNPLREGKMFWNNAARRQPKMQLIDLPRGRIGMTFRHRKYSKPTLNSEIAKRFMNGFTRCEIYTIDGRDAKLIASGIGVAKFPDTFCKALGRKYALTSALRNKIGTGLVFNKGERQAIWEAYWQMVAPPAPPDATPSAAAAITDMLAAADAQLSDATFEGMPEDSRSAHKEEP